MFKQLKSIFGTFSIDTDAPLPEEYDLRGYTIDRVIHRGGMSWVYKAWDPKGKAVIIKEFFPHKSAERVDGENVASMVDREPFFKEAFRRFHEEGRYMGMFRGPYFVRIRSFFRFNDTGYMVLEWERGRTLASYIRIPRHQFPDFKLVLRLVTDVRDALLKMHNEHVVHMDIHPANIFLNLQGRAVLLDFGATRHVAEPVLNSARFFTPGFSAPEVKNSLDWGPWCDIYSFGACLKAAGFLREDCPYPAEFKKLIQRCMVEHYRQRPQSFDDPLFDFEKMIKEYAL